MGDDLGTARVLILGLTLGALMWAALIAGLACVHRHG